MRIALISGSRSDRNALVMVQKALSAAGHVTRLIELGPEGMVGSSRWALPKKPWHPVIATEKALFWTGMNVNGFGHNHVGRADLAIMHGDRHEVLGAAVACNVMGIPIAHIGGGDITEGSQDDCFRHAITKLSHLHFASCQDSADRIVQMGEEPDRVHVTGCPGIDMVMATPTLGRDETFAAVGLMSCNSPFVGAREHYVDEPPIYAPAPQRSLLVLFHPNTLGDTAAELKALSDALMARKEALVLLGPNADAGSDLIRQEWHRIVEARLPRSVPLKSPKNYGITAVYHDTVEPQVFYSLLKWCDVLVGNSSAGFYEAPCFGIPVLNFGDRQMGRPQPDNIAPCPANYGESDIAGMIDILVKSDRRGKVKSLYGDGHAAERIAKVTGGIKDPRALLRKKFYQRRLIEPWETVTS